MEKPCSLSDILVELRTAAARARRLAHDLAPSEERSRLLHYAEEVEERALRIETVPSSNESH